MSSRIFSIGTDPEFFLEKNGELVSAIPYIKGNKFRPQELPSGGFVMKDNVAIEFGIKPAYSGKEWLKNLSDAMRDIKELLPKELKLICIPSADFPMSELDHPEAKKFGCDPDFNAWRNSEQNIPPEGCENRPFRSCGGHIHVGYVEDSGYDFLLDPKGKELVIQAMDVHHGIISTILDSSPAAVRRKELYGKAGCYRPTEYGVEYRTLSNYWMLTDGLMLLMYTLVGDVLYNVLTGIAEDMIEEMTSKEIQRIINEGDVQSAVSVVKDVLWSDLSEATQDLYVKRAKEIV